MTQETRDLFHWLSALIALPAAAYAGQPFFRQRLAAPCAPRRLNMDVPISLGVVLALAMSAGRDRPPRRATPISTPPSCCSSSCLCGRYLDRAMRRKTRAVAGNLAGAEGRDRASARGERRTRPRCRPPRLNPGDRVLVRPGDRIPADGAILGGTSEIDESLVTGETLPRAVGAGTTVYAGSINISGALTLRVTAAGAGTLVEEVERLLDKAIAAKSQTVRLADRAAQFYAPVVHATAGRLPRSRSSPGRITAPIPSSLPETTDINSDVLERAARLALSSHHPLAASLARQAACRTPYAGAVETAGQGVRTLINGEEARLGGVTFCGLADAATQTMADTTAARPSSPSPMPAATRSLRSVNRCATPLR